jgi:hypothetical protein
MNLNELRAARQERLDQAPQTDAPRQRTTHGMEDVARHGTEDLAKSRNLETDQQNYKRHEGKAMDANTDLDAWAKGHAKKTDELNAKHKEEGPSDREWEQEMRRKVNADRTGGLTSFEDMDNSPKHSQGKKLGVRM